MENLGRKTVYQNIDGKVDRCEFAGYTAKDWEMFPEHFVHSCPDGVGRVVSCANCTGELEKN